MIVLLHSSKTMRAPQGKPMAPRSPMLLAAAAQLGEYLKTLSTTQLQKAMHLSPSLAQKTHGLIDQWSPSPDNSMAAIDSFVGDIYSGLRASSLSQAERTYADKTLCILSGLYGVLRPLDTICPYRLEMGYRLPDAPFTNLYAFWGESIAQHLPKQGLVVNASSVEYTKAVLPYINEARVVTPQFLTVNSKTSEPTFVVVHAKIARGAFARWIIQHRIEEVEGLTQFNDLGYQYNKTLSTLAQPVFVCQEFGGIGLSMRLE